MHKASQSRRLPLWALAILAGAISSLLAAIWAGWLRLGWNWPPLQPDLPGVHGALMISGFLGTLVALERAVALQQRWMYAAPILSALGALTLVFGAPALLGAALVTLGSFGLAAIFVVIVRRHLALYTAMMALGALAWLVGNLFWLSGWSVPRVVLWWAAFLILTIAGERLELGRLLRLSSQATLAFAASTGILIVGLLATLIDLGIATRVAGLGMLLLALWLLRFDIARRTVRQGGLPRFAAVCLLSGYVWLGLGGSIGVFSGAVAAGLRYDAFLHSIFVGFVISMIFGHAPIIFPAVLQLPITYRPVFYSHLLLLHASLIVRLAGDLMGNYPLRLWGGLLNGIAILLFLANTAFAIYSALNRAKLE